MSRVIIRLMEILGAAVIAVAVTVILLLCANSADARQLWLNDRLVCHNVVQAASTTSAIKMECLAYHNVKSRKQVARARKRVSGTIAYNATKFAIAGKPVVFPIKSGAKGKVQRLAIYDSGTAMLPFTTVMISENGTHNPNQAVCVIPGAGKVFSMISHNVLQSISRYRCTLRPNTEYKVVVMPHIYKYDRRSKRYSWVRRSTIAGKYYAFKVNIR